MRLYRQRISFNTMVFSNLSDTFSTRLTTWQHQFGRHHLPWQHSSTSSDCTQRAYQVWVSEIMLQQTQVNTVIPYYQRFLTRFPTVAALANAEQDSVLEHWSGLGYYSRARNLHHSAQEIMHKHHGIFPNTREALMQLKGVGRSTAAAISVFAFGQREAILDGNVKRILTRHRGIYGTNHQTEQQLWQLAESLLPYQVDALRAHTQGLMDLGSLICMRTKPLCEKCPVQTDCYAHQQQKTQELPEKRPKAPKPVKNGYFLVLRNQLAHIHLEKRAEKGIWGGLYALPWFESLTALTHYCNTNQLTDISHQTEAALTHHFTHYTLRLYVSHAHIDTTDKTIDIPFYPLKQLHTLALPTAMRKLLTYLTLNEQSASPD